MTAAVSVAQGYNIVTQLKHFGYTKFDDKVIEKLQKEMHKVVREAKKDHNLDRSPSTRTYQTRTQRRIKRRKLEGDVQLSWKDDAGEYAERI